MRRDGRGRTSCCVSLKAEASAGKRASCWSCTAEAHGRGSRPRSERLALAPYVPARALVVGVHARAHLRVPLLVHIVQGLFGLDWQKRPTRGAQQTMAPQLLLLDRLRAVQAPLLPDDFVVLRLVLVRGITISLPERMGGERVAGDDIQNKLDLSSGWVVEGEGGI